MNNTNDMMSRYIQMDDWIFEIKTVRAIRVSDYGKPYSAIANVNLRGSEAYIDGLMTRNENDFTSADFDTFQKFCRKLGAKQMKYDRFKADQCKSIIVDLDGDEIPLPQQNIAPVQKHKLRLV